MAFPVYRADRARRDFTQSLIGRIWWLTLARDKSDSDSEPGGTPAWRDRSASSSRTLPGLDDVASIEEVVEIIGKERRWIIRNAADLPFVTRISRKHYVCSRIALRRWLATRPRALKGR